MTTETLTPFAPPTPAATVAPGFISAALEYFPDALVTYFDASNFCCLAKLTEDHFIVISDHDTEPTLALSAMPAWADWGCFDSESIGDALVCHFTPS